MSDRFEIVETKNESFLQNPPAATETPNAPEAPAAQGTPTSPAQSAGNKMVNALADNMGNIISLVRDIAEIKKLRVQSEADLAKLEKKKELLYAEAEVYIEKKNAENKGIIDRMKYARDILNDFYNQKDTGGLSGEEFASVINAMFAQKQI